MRSAFAKASAYAKAPADKTVDKLLIATTNPNKLREIRPLLAALAIELLTLANFPPVPEPEETGSTFWENARIKALAYEEDSKADVDMNIVKTGDGRFVEIQGTAEAEPFGMDALTGLLSLADKGVAALIARQREIVGPILGR